MVAVRTEVCSILLESDTQQSACQVNEGECITQRRDDIATLIEQQRRG